MGRIQQALSQYSDPEGPAPGRRQVNARPLLEDFAKLQVMCKHYKVTKSRLATDLLEAAIGDAFDALMEHDDGTYQNMLADYTEAIKEEEENAQ